MRSGYSDYGNGSEDQLCCDPGIVREFIFSFCFEKGNVRKPEWRILNRIGFDGGRLTGKSGLSRKNFSGIQKSVWIEGFLDSLHDLNLGLGSREV